MTDKKEVHEHEDMDTIFLNLEDGSEIECGIIGIFDTEDKEYMALFAIEEEEVLLFQYEEKEDEFELNPIEDDKEFEVACDAYYELVEENEDD
ncbi:MAG TPA: DUF1292 domain-containing protein [Tissierellaceae bacterium]|nr:DUF1292 domain-containing protein [Tissierellaceae bacterium]